MAPPAAAAPAPIDEDYASTTGGERLVGFDVAENLVAADLGQLEVEQDQVGAGRGGEVGKPSVGVDEVQGFLTILDPEDALHAVAVLERS